MHSTRGFWEQILAFPGNPLCTAGLKTLLKLTYLKLYTELLKPTDNQGKGRYLTPGTTSPRVSTTPAIPSPNALCTDICLSIT